MASTFLQRTKELKAANPTMTAMEAARQARVEISPTTPKISASVDIPSPPTVIL